MVCIYCDNETRVINSRHQRRQNHVWRRRQCLVCHNIFTSIEKPELSNSIVVKGQDGQLEGFEREKLLISVYESCRHRKTAVGDATALTETIIGRLQGYIVDAAVARNDVVGVTSEVLKRFDRAARVQYLAYHPV